VRKREQQLVRAMQLAEDNMINSLNEEAMKANTRKMHKAKAELQ